ncbi:MAG: FecR family protein [Oceanococcus sp.]
MKTHLMGCLLALVLAVPAAAQDMAGKALLVVGKAYATDAAGAARTLSRGDAIFSGDTITTFRHSYVNVSYTDEGRTLIGPNSQLKIAQYSYKPTLGGPRNRTAAKSANQGRSVFALLKGGFRAVTGLIGRASRDNYSIQTSVATIGIRGTDAVYVDCSDGRCGNVGPGGSDDPNSVLIGVYSGGVSAMNEQGQTADVDPDQFIQATKNAFFRLAGTPGILLTMPMADPNTCE